VVRVGWFDDVGRRNERSHLSRTYAENGGVGAGGEGGGWWMEGGGGAGRGGCVA
jgi:hypothetical protein